MRDFAVELKSRGVAIAVSNNDTDLVRRLYVQEADCFDVHEIHAPRAMHSRSVPAPRSPKSSSSDDERNEAPPPGSPACPLSVDEALRIEGRSRNAQRIESAIGFPWW